MPDPNAAQNHGWRHRFKTVGMEAGIAPRILDAIQGQAARSVADSHGDVTLKTMAAAIANLAAIFIDAISQLIFLWTRRFVRFLTHGSRWECLFVSLISTLMRNSSLRLAPQTFIQFDVGPTGGITAVERARGPIMDVGNLPCGCVAAPDQ